MVKKYHKNSFYHVYNRGIDKRDIFKDAKDYKYLLGLIENKLSPVKYKLDKITGEIYTTPNLKYMGNKIEIYAYCLMPNHFHLLLRQLETKPMIHFMQSICTSYAMHYKFRYEISGRVFQSTYKARELKSERQVNKIIDYIHSNPEKITKISQYPWSSYKAYVGRKNVEWLTKLG